MSKYTLVVGASVNPTRYSYKATEMLLKHGHPVFLFGRNEGEILEQIIHTSLPDIVPMLHTITIYINPAQQEQIANELIALRPKRIIFNPGTENPELEKLATQHGIEVIHACTLVLLSTEIY
ncbi:MAG: CoA-binding protein [Candidatus Competibacteraceae bacterium]|nr:CoA-binding protein [Candidatus Competibacteraceae bacterium]